MIIMIMMNFTYIVSTVLMEKFLLSTTLQLLKIMSSLSIIFYHSPPPQPSFVLCHQHRDHNHHHHPSTLFVKCTVVLLTLLTLATVFALAAATTFDSPYTNDPYYGRFVGSFHDVTGNGIAGDLYFVNNQALFLYNFSYDGQGTDIYFKVGTSRDPSSIVTNIGGSSSNGGGLIIADELGRTTKLSKYSQQNLLLTLPREISSKDLRWLALWSNTFGVSIGQVLIVHQVSVPDKQNLGPLLATKNMVQADAVWALDDKTLSISGLRFKSDINTNCGFYVGTGNGPSVYGVKIPDENGSFQRLRNYFNENIILRLPRDLSLVHLDWFAINDVQQKQSYGHVLIRKGINLPPNMAFILTYVTSFSNCETVLPNLMHLSWEIRHPNIYIQLEARIASNQYAAFGLSGTNDKSTMIGSDVFVVFFDAKTNRVILDDYILLGKSQCNRQTRTGVCPDTLLGGVNNLELLMSSYIDGLIKVTFRRPLRTTDLAHDIPFVISKHANIVAAIGTLTTERTPSYHTVAVNTKFHLAKHKPLDAIDFGRPNSQRNCDPPLWQQVVNQPTNIFNTGLLSSSPLGSQAAEAEAHSMFEIEPWKPAVIEAKNGHVFRVMLGPTGPAQQGYTSITGIESPGLAYWIDDLLIPEIRVTRGHNYTFILETGDNVTDSAHYHPFYITDSREGGDGSIRPERLNIPGNRVYAGVDMRWGYADPRPGTGRYCELVPNPQVVDSYGSSIVRSIEEYRKTLNLQCKPGNIGAFQWRPDESTADVVYYQCFVHRYLGWKIVVTSSASSSGQTLPSLWSSPLSSSSPSSSLIFSLSLLVPSLLSSLPLYGIVCILCYYHTG